MRIEAKRVIIGLLEDFARKTEEPTEKEKQEGVRQRKQAMLEWKTEIEANPGRLLNVTGFCINANEGVFKLREFLNKKYPLAGILSDRQGCERIGFRALNIDVLVRGVEKIKKFQALSKQIDNCFLEGDAVNLVDLIKKALG